MLCVIADVKFMYMAQGSKDRYQYLVDDPTKDIFTLTVGSTAESIDVSVDPFVKRMKESECKNICSILDRVEFSG